MPRAYLNRIATAVPPNDVHHAFVDYASRNTGQGVEAGPGRRRAVERLAEKGGIEHRFSVYRPPDRGVDGAGWDAYYHDKATMSTAGRMRVFDAHAADLAVRAVEGLDLGPDRQKISHLIITCCTGFTAPGVDLQVIERCGLNRSVERTLVGFMGCYAAVNALKLARHIVRSEPEAKVLVLNLELCTLHLKETRNMEEILSFLLFGDGCAASLVSAEPTGLSLDSFKAVLAPDTAGMITWDIGEFGFDMVLSGQVPVAIRTALSGCEDAILQGAAIGDIDLWAIHPGGRSVLDAVQDALDLPPEALWASREVLRAYGNMSSPTVMFVLKALMEKARPGERGCAMAFGPGLMAETLLFEAA